MTTHDELIALLDALLEKYREERRIIATLLEKVDAMIAAKG